MKALRPLWYGAVGLFGWSVFMFSLAVFVLLGHGFSYGTSDSNRVTAESQPFVFWSFEIGCLFIAVFLLLRAIKEFRTWRQRHH